MVKITYDLNNKKDVELVENYYWLKYQLKVINFDIFCDDDLDDFIVLEDANEENNKKLKEIILEFSCEIDLIRMAEILNTIHYQKHDYINWIRIMSLFSTKHFIKAYRRKLIQKFATQEYYKDIIT